MIKLPVKNHHQIFDQPESIMLGKEATSNKVNLYYEKMRQKFDKQSIENLKLKDIQNSNSTIRREKTDLNILPKSSIIARDRNLISRRHSSKSGSLSKSALSNFSRSRLPSSKNPLFLNPPIVRPKKNTSIRYSAREKLVLDW